MILKDVSLYLDINPKVTVVKATTRRKDTTTR